MVEHAQASVHERRDRHRDAARAAARLRPPQEARADRARPAAPCWRQPLLLRPAPCCCWAAAVAAAGGRGASGWLVEARSRVDAHRPAPSSAPSRRSSWSRSRSRAATMSSAAPSWARSASSAAIRSSASTCRRSRQRLEAIAWVASATVERRLPDTLYRHADASAEPWRIWQTATEYILIDRDGRTVRASRIRRAPRSCCCSSAPARPSMSASCCCCWPTSRPSPRQVRAAVWVGQRRWNLAWTTASRSGCPRRTRSPRLKQLAELDDQHKLLDARVRRRRSAAAGQALCCRKRGPGRRDDARSRS